MGGGDGLSDCDAHGTLVASMIAASPATWGTPGAGAAATAACSDPGTTAASAASADDQCGPAAPADHHDGSGSATDRRQDRPAPACPRCPPAPRPPPGRSQAPGSRAPGSRGRAARPAPRGSQPWPRQGRAARLFRWRHGRSSPSITRDRPRRRRWIHRRRGPADAFTGVAPDVDLISIRQFSQAFGLKDAYTGDQDPQTRQKSDDIRTMARAIVHAADMGARVINISQVMCMSSRSMIDQPDLGAAVRYAAVDKDAVIVAAAGDTSQRDCKENPIVDPLHPSDARDWNGVTTVVTPSWFSDYVLTVGAVDSSGTPMDKLSVAGPWVSIGAPGTDVLGLSPRDDSLINAIDGPDNSLLVPAGTSFSTAIVSGVAALVRANIRNCRRTRSSTG